MQVDSIVATTLHHGTCVVLQNDHFYEGKNLNEKSKSPVNTVDSIPGL